jgi:ParB family transcriptional regulator, chromosome partitioning protein
MARKALGKGLRALIPDAGDQDGTRQASELYRSDSVAVSTGLAEPAMATVELGPDRSMAGGERQDGLAHIPIERIQPNRNQPRVDINPEGLRELADSIREKGLLEPIIVRPNGAGYELVAGERRWRACSLAGLQSVPALIRRMEPDESLELALIENIQREDLNPVEEARAYQRLAEHFGRTHEEISRSVGKDRSTVTNLLRILRLPDEILLHVSRGTLSVGHVRVLLGAPAGRQVALAEQAVAAGWSVREMESRCDELTAGQGGKRGRPAKRGQKKPEHVMRIEELLCRHFATEARIRVQRGRGRIEIHFHDEEELSRLLELLGVAIS